MNERLLISAKYGLIPRKPVLIARIVGFYLGSFVINTNPLRYVDFAINDGNDCNLACEHCFPKKRDQNHGRRMEPADYARVADEAVKLGAIHLSFQGGEPTLDPRLEEIVKAIRPHRVLVSFTTNGTTATYANCLKWRSWGVDQLNVSVDSMNPDEHDRIRGKLGTFRTTMNGINNAHASGLHVQINTVVSKKNVYSRSFLDLLDWSKSRRYIHNLVLAAPSGNWAGDTGVLLDPEDHYFVQRLIRYRPNVRHDRDAIKLGQGCPAMKAAIYITPYGDLLSCPFIPISHGNVLHNSLKLLRDSALSKYAFLSRHEKQCLVAEDRTFINRYMSKTWERNLPASASEIYGEPKQ